MSQIEIFLIVVVAAAVSLAGWGWTVTQLAGSPGLPVALVAAVGMAALLFLGGMLNLARCAVPHAIDGLVLMGLGLAGLALYRNRARFTVKWRPDHAVTILGMGAVGFIVLRHLTPQSAFNWNDDFERYFSYPVRMLQTGTVGGNPLGYMGVDTLGGQAFLQTFLVRYFPIEYIGSLDTGVALLLCLALAGGAGPNRQGVVLTAAAQLALIAIDPQLVNVSSVFRWTKTAISRLARSARRSRRRHHLRGMLSRSRRGTGAPHLRAGGIDALLLPNADRDLPRHHPIARRSRRECPPETTVDHRPLGFRAFRRFLSVASEEIPADPGPWFSARLHEPGNQRVLRRLQSGCVARQDAGDPPNHPGACARR
jgi:hypothetical protein